MPQEWGVYFKLKLRVVVAIKGQCSLYHIIIMYYMYIIILLYDMVGWATIRTIYAYIVGIYKLPYMAAFVASDG